MITSSQTRRLGSRCSLIRSMKRPQEQTADRTSRPHRERYYPPARIRAFHHSGPEIPGSAREGKPRSFFLCFAKIFKKVVAFGVTRAEDPRAWTGWVRRRVDRLSENDASSSATRKWLLLTSKSEMLASKSLFLTSKSEMLTNKSLFLTSKSEMLASKSLFLIADVEPGSVRNSV